MEKESFAIRSGIQVFHVHLLGRPLLHAQTDNRALQWIDWLKRDYLLQWNFALQPFQFQVEHQAGKSKVNTVKPNHFGAGKGNVREWLFSE